jgi:hypothetical protein
MAQKNKPQKTNVAARNGGNGGYAKRSPVKDLWPRKMKQNIGRDGSVKAPKS